MCLRRLWESRSVCVAVGCDTSCVCVVLKWAEMEQNSPLKLPSDGQRSREVGAVTAELFAIVRLHLLFRWRQASNYRRQELHFTGTGGGAIHLNVMNNGWSWEVRLMHFNSHTGLLTKLSEGCRLGFSPPDKTVIIYFHCKREKYVPLTVSLKTCWSHILAKLYYLLKPYVISKKNIFSSASWHNCPTDILRFSTFFLFLVKHTRFQLM